MTILRTNAPSLMEYSILIYETLGSVHYCLRRPGNFARIDSPKKERRPLPARPLFICFKKTKYLGRTGRGLSSDFHGGMG